MENFRSGNVRRLCETINLLTCYLRKLSPAPLPLGGGSVGFRQSRRFELLRLETQALSIESIVHLRRLFVVSLFPKTIEELHHPRPHLNAALDHETVWIPYDHWKLFRLAVLIKLGTVGPDREAVEHDARCLFHDEFHLRHVSIKSMERR